MSRVYGLHSTHFKRFADSNHSIDINQHYCQLIRHVTIPVAVRSEAQVCVRSIFTIAGSNPAEGMDACPFCVLS